MKQKKSPLLSIFSWNKVTYRGLETEERDSSDGHVLLEKHASDSTNFPNRGTLLSKFAVFLILLILAASLLTNTALIFQLRRFSNLDRICSHHTSEASPILKDVDIIYKSIVFNASLTRKTIYREEPSEEVDQAWVDLGTQYHVVRIPEEDGPKYGLRQHDHVKYPPEFGGGFPANVEVLHHLHCVNMLRQTNHYNFAYYSAIGQGVFKNSEPNLRDHIGHCVDILRQELMCQADYGVFGQVWVERYEALTDFYPRHTCKNFEDIREWAKVNQAPTTGPESKVRFRPDDVRLSEVP